jgi:hypothetical protein
MIGSAGYVYDDHHTTMHVAGRLGKGSKRLLRCVLHWELYSESVHQIETTIDHACPALLLLAAAVWAEKVQSRRYRIIMVTTVSWMKLLLGSCF